MAQKSSFLKQTGLIVLIAVLIVLVLMLLENVRTRQAEALQTHFVRTPLTEASVDPVLWAPNFPHQYDSYLRTVDVVRTRHGGSEAFQRLDEFPIYKELFAGYAFSIDYREERGHAYMLSDQRETERVHKVAQPGACLHCHASMYSVYRDAGRKAGVPDPKNPKDYEEQLMKGFEVVNPMPYHEATKLANHPVACIDCHDPQTTELRITRPGFFDGIRALATSTEPLPHLPSIERWRQGDRKVAYDPNRDATHQEMRSFVCGQCHVEYYFKGSEKRLTYPWHKGIDMAAAEAYYDEVGHTDFVHTVSKANVLKAQHPEFEMWGKGVHARSSVACADCHMPYERVGAVKVSSHHVRSPMLNVHKACLTCHAISEQEMKDRVAIIQDRTQDLLHRAELAVMDLVYAIRDHDQTQTEALKIARDMHRKSQWRMDYVAAENSMGFHAPQEVARILGEAIDYSRKGIMALKAKP